jgi:hypothetical protein
VIKLALINTSMINKQVTATHQALHQLSSSSGVPGSALVDSEKNILATTSVMEDSAVNGSAASESIADLLIDRVTFRKYRCPKEECRKTFDEPADLFSHIGTHVSVK